MLMAKRSHKPASKVDVQAQAAALMDAHRIAAGVTGLEDYSANLAMVAAVVAQGAVAATGSSVDRIISISPQSISGTGAMMR